MVQRPIGWWLKEADGRIDDAFEAALHDHGVDRRGWQVLATLAEAPTRRAEVAAALAPFAEPSVVHGVVDELEARGWVGEVDGMLELTPDGVREQQDLATDVGQVRGLVAAALSEDEYATLLGLLARVVEALPARRVEALP